jgi:cyclopropane fatty-acyl-phospholipid synthase-like methyltransferase
MSDYLSIEYSAKKRPLTDYPSKLAQYLVKTFNLKPNQSILEIGCGRCELLSHFGEIGLDTYGVDSAISAAGYAKTAKANFELIEFKPDMSEAIFGGKKFDIIFTKSFIEHIPEPISFFRWCNDLLVDGGKIITLTPDWESNYKIFYDDFTHVKPFTEVSLNQALEASGYEEISVFRFRQLPATWNSKTMEVLSKITAVFASHRSKNKWLRWSRELMIASIGIKSNH